MGFDTHCAADLPSRFTSLNRKEISASASSFRLQVLLCCHKQIPKAARTTECSAGISTCFPFETLKEFKREVAPPILLIYNDLSNLLGSAHPVLIAILPVPLSTSAVKVLISLITTTTKICTKGSSRQVHTHPSAETSAPFYSRVDATSNPRCCISVRL